MTSSKSVKSPETNSLSRDTKSNTKRNTEDTERHQYGHTETHKHKITVELDTRKTQKTQKDKDTNTLRHTNTKSH